MNRLDRRDLLLRLLQDRPGITVTQLAAQVHASRRSVFRDLAALRERGYPLMASRGRGGGLRLPPHWGLGRIMLSAEEAVSALLSLAVAEHLGLPLFTRDLKQVRAKIVAAFPEAQRATLKKLRERILVGPAASNEVRTSYREPRKEVARELQSAFVRERIITIAYAKSDGEQSVREIEPHVILLNWPAWYVLAHDHLREGTRTFRLDRVVSITTTPTSFRPRPRAVVRLIGGLEFADPDLWSL